MSSTLHSALVLVQLHENCGILLLTLKKEKTSVIGSTIFSFIIVYLFWDEQLLMNNMTFI